MASGSSGRKRAIAVVDRTCISIDVLLLESLLSNNGEKYSYLILELFGDEKLHANKRINDLLLENLEITGNDYLRELSFRSLLRMNFNDHKLQNKLAKVYSELEKSEKARVLNVLELDMDEWLIH